MQELLAVMTITVLAVISPGADFAMVTRESWRHGRRAGLWAALGIAAGVQVHVAYTLVGVGLLIAQLPWLFTGIKWVGAAYLVYIGWRTLKDRSPVVDVTEESPSSSAAAIDLDEQTSTRWREDLQAFRTGFFTNALNPKCTLFVVSTFTQVVHPGTGWGLGLAYGAFMSFAHWVWFSLVALGFSAGWMRAAMVRRQHLVRRTIGGALMTLGGLLAMASR
ncbi:MULTISPECIES: LysE family translocator [Pandoraea]|uniref:LysE family translocator n=1 Tax=Pandoraea TaxID=93217 RepID=UPI001F5DE044|nr:MULTISPECIES: LysE family translocator [Pandoraea]MCI3206099.1 lysine transporter LysE [Pandoraea sp. LA3]MDN4584127.1 lysine transporter LysE [Pandoraea capi]